MPVDNIRPVVIDDAQLIFKNFTGLEGKYNRAGDRSSSVLLDDDTADQLEREGWNVKSLKAREEGDTPQKYLTFSVRYPDNNKVIPPVIWLITSQGKTPIGEDLVAIIDQSDIAKVDLILRPYVWSVNGNTGVKAYLKSMYVFLAEDELALRYADIPEIGAGAPQQAIGTGHDVIEGEAWEVNDNQLAIER